MNLEKPGTGIFLMRERAKLYKGSGERKKHTIAKRLSDHVPLNRLEEAKNQCGDKRIKGNGGKPVPVISSQNQDQVMKQNK